MHLNLINKTKHIKGAATAELLISLLVAIPLFLAIPLLGKYASIRHKTVEAARYLAWERVVWNSGISKSNQQLQLEVSDRFLGNTKAGIISGSDISNIGVSDNPSWRDYATQSLLISNQSPVKANVTHSTPQLGINHNAIVNKIASSGFLLNKKIGLSDSSFEQYEVVVPFIERTVSKNILSGSILNFKEKSGLLLDSWNATTNTQYKNRIKGLTFENEVNTLTFPTKFIGYFPIYKERTSANNPDFVPDAKVILNEYIHN